MENQNQRNFKLTNMMFLLMALGFIGGSFALGALEVSLKQYLFITQYGLVLMPSLVFLKLNGHSLKKALRLKKISAKVAFKSLIVTLAALPIAYTLNFIMTFVLSKLDWVVVNELDLGTGRANYIIMLFLMAVTPGICEEVFFRGMMLSGYEKVLSPQKTIVLTGLLFAVFHFEPQNFMLPALLGMIFAWLVMTTGSIYTSMLGHASFNAIGVSLTYFSKDIEGADPKASIDAMKNNDPQIIGVIVFMVALSILCGFFLKFAMKSLKKTCVQAEVGDQLRVNKHVFDILEITPEAYGVESLGLKKYIKFTTLKNKSFDIIKVKSARGDQGQVSPLNYLYLALVGLVYIGLFVLSRA